MVGDDHLKPEEADMPAPHDQEVSEDAQRRAAVAEALASVRAEGLEPSVEGLALLEAVAAGRISTEQACTAILARCRR